MIVAPIDNLVKKALAELPSPDAHPDKGGGVQCENCRRALDVPDLDWRSVKTVGDVYAVLSGNAEANGWKHRIVNMAGLRTAVFTCPICIPRKEEAMSQILPRLSNPGHCGACGARGAIIAMRACKGLSSDCEFGAPREHIHRTCGQCGHKWIEGRIDDPNTREQCTKSSALRTIRTVAAMPARLWKKFSWIWTRK